MVDVDFCQVLSFCFSDKFTDAYHITKITK